MKKINIYMLSILGVFAQSCNKYLGVSPDNRTEINSKEKIDEILGTAYPQANWIPTAEAMSDNATDKGEGIGTVYFDSQQAYQYLDNSGTAQDTPNNYWNSSYEAINAANQALDAITKLGDGANLASEKAEALLCRAYAHFMLVTLYAKPFGASSQTDMGVPYVTEVEKIVNKKYTRATVAEVYDLIKNDIEAALPNIDDTRYKVPKYHFNKAAAYAFATRFYLFKKDYEQALKYANLALPSTFNVAGSLRPWLTLFRGTSNDILINYTKATLPSNLLLVEAGSLWDRTYANNRFGTTYELFDGSALMKGLAPASNVTGNSRWAYRTYIIGQDNPFYPKWNEFFYTPDDPSVGYPYVMMPLFTVDDVLLNRAEINVFLGKNDDALKDINIFVSQRFMNYSTSNNVTVAKALSYYKTTVAQDALLSTVLDFRRVEFLYEGLRWLDILRYDIGVKHFIKDKNFNITETITLAPGDLRRQWQLPESVSSAGVERNPR